jgi:hypothetical protein
MIREANTAFKHRGDFAGHGSSPCGTSATLSDTHVIASVPIASTISWRSMSDDASQ